MNGKPSYSRGVLLCLLATVAWGGMFPIMTRALQHIDPFTFTCMRYGIAGTAFLVLLVILEGRNGLRLKGERYILAWLFGTAGFAGFQFLVFFGQKLIGPGGELVASIIMATMPLLGFLVTWALRKVAPPKGTLVFMAFSFVGVVLVVSQGDIAGLLQRPELYGPAALILFAALCWVIYTSGAAFFPAWSPYKYTAITTCLGLASACVITALIVAFGGVSIPSVSTVVTIAPELAYMSMLAGFVAVLSWNIGNKILTPLNGVLFMDVVPITAFTVTAILGVVPATVQIIGAAMTATALIFNNLYLRRHNRGVAAPRPAPKPKGEPAALVER